MRAAGLAFTGHDSSLHLVGVPTELDDAFVYSGETLPIRTPPRSSPSAHDVLDRAAGCSLTETGLSLTGTLTGTGLPLTGALTGTGPPVTGLLTGTRPRMTGPLTRTMVFT